MNENHARLCSSPEWATFIGDDVLAPLGALVDLGKEMLEVGPGPGAATAWLAPRVGHLVALEHGPVAAKSLAARFAGSSVEVVEGDATATGFAPCSFDTVGAFTMLHHLPTVAQQNRLLAEAFRVLRPGGAFIGSDSLASDGLHQFHEGDTYNPVEPSAFLVRLQAIGFTRVTLIVDDVLRFIARKPRPEDLEPPDCDHDTKE